MTTNKILIRRVETGIHEEIDAPDGLIIHVGKKVYSIYPDKDDLTKADLLLIREIDGDTLIINPRSSNVIHLL